MAIGQFLFLKQESVLQTSTVKRSAFAVVGVLLVGVAAVGAMLPGIPTVGPLMLASFFLMKSSPSLERRLIRNRFFGKYICYLDGSSTWSTRMRVTSIAMMWTSILISSLITFYFRPNQRWLLAVLGVAGIIGTCVIWWFRRKVNRAPIEVQSPNCSSRP
ncbi:MAG: uncharacterized membrane protein YbaN (DUF454 family) [Mariniblastus sp.]